MPERALADHPFVAGLGEDDLMKLAACVVGRSEWRPGEAVLTRGEPADVFHLIVDGRIAIEIRKPGSTPHTIQTLHGGNLLGWSWLHEPYRWAFDARAAATTTAITLDAALVRNTIEADPAFGLAIVIRVLDAIVSRLEATRLQVLDVYGA